MTYQVAAYYFPEYHRETRNDHWHGTGWDEWELVRAARPRFPGHQQPKVPLWGYEDEADPTVMARKIDAAADHALDCFIFDWYWYDNAPFLARALDEGFLGAPNNARLKFALMWANHDWFNLHPYGRSTTRTLLATGRQSRAHFEAATDYVVQHYLRHPSYWRIDGGAYFSFYELMSLVQGLGGIEAARAALDQFRATARAAGAGELHLNAVVWGIRILPGEQPLHNPKVLLNELGFDSVTSYVWVHNTPMTSFPTVAYPDYARLAGQDWPRFAAEYPLPYYPNVTMGWDSSPRTAQTDRYDNVGYPFGSILTGNTPEEFGKALGQAREFLDGQPREQRILTINAWNEWTEGSYLEPDTAHGLAYLEALQRVFGAVPSGTPAEGQK